MKRISYQKALTNKRLNFQITEHRDCKRLDKLSIKSLIICKRHFVINKSILLQYDAYSQNQMSKKGTQTILQHYLRRAPHRSTHTLNKITLQLSSRTPLVSDEDYLDRSLSQIFCDFLITDEYYHVRNQPNPFIQKPLLFCVPRLFNEQVELRKSPAVEARIERCLDKLQTPSYLLEAYDQIEQLLHAMTLGQAYQYKQHLMHINNVIVSKNGKAEAQDHHGVQLRQKVINKIFESLENKEERTQVLREINRLEIVASARCFAENGQHEQAKTNYELVFGDEENSDALRMEALEFLCQDGQQKGDQHYLNSIMNKVKQGGSQKLLECVERALQLVKTKPQNSVNADQIQK